MNVTEMRESDRPAWDDYVHNSTQGLPHHLSGWRDIFTNSYGFQTLYLIAKDSGKVVGIFPILIVRSFLVGSRATSVQGGLCADDDEIATELITYGKEVATQAGVNQLVLQDTRLAWPGNFHTSNRHVHWVIDIDFDLETLWKNLPRKVRYEVRKAQKNGLQSQVFYNQERLDDLYYILSHFFHQVGSPTFSRPFLKHVTQSFPGSYHYILVYRGKLPIGGYFNLDLERRSYGIWGSTLSEYLPLGTAYLAYWTIISDAMRAGFRYLDLGRSPAGSNSSAFKAKWGGISKPIYQQILNIKADHCGQIITDQIQSGGKYRLFMDIWSKLPYPLVQFFGPKLRQLVPFA